MPGASVCTRATRSSALRCPSWRRNTWTMRSRLEDRLPPGGTDGITNGDCLLDRERLAASARRRRLRVLDGEAAARHRVDEVHFRALQVADADRIDEQLHAV